MASKRKSSVFESELDNGTNAAQLGEGAGLLGSTAPSTTTSAPASKRRKRAIPKAPALSTPAAKKRGRPSGKRSSIISSAYSSRASTPATQTSAQGLPQGQFSAKFNTGPDEDLYTAYNVLARTTSAARGDTALSHLTQGIELHSYQRHEPPQDVDTTSPSFSWEPRHESTIVHPIDNRDNHPHVELVVHLTDEINALHKKATTAEASQIASYNSNKKLIQQNAALKKNRAQLLDWLKENASDVQLPAELVNDDLTSTVSPTPFICQSPTVEPTCLDGTGLPTSPIVDLTREGDQLAPSSTLPVPLSVARAADPEVQVRYRIRVVQNLSPGELQLENARLQSQYHEANSTIAALTKEITFLKENTKSRKSLSNTQLEAEVDRLKKRIEELEDTRATLADAVLEFARIERSVTDTCLRYEAFVRHIEEEMRTPGAVAAAKKWIDTHNEPNDTHFLYEGIASAGVLGAPLDWQQEAAQRDSGDAVTSGVIDPALSSVAGRNNSFATMDSGYVEAENLVPPKTTTAAVHEVGFHADMLQDVSQVMMPVPALLGNLDDNASSPETMINASRNQDATASSLSPRGITYEDNKAAGEMSFMQDLTGNIDFGPALTSMKNAGNSHGDGGNVLSGVGEGFENYPNSMPHTNKNAGLTQNEYAANPQTVEMDPFEANSMSNIHWPHFAEVSSYTYHKPQDDLPSTSTTASDSSASLACPFGPNATLPVINNTFDGAFAMLDKENTQHTQTAENSTSYPQPPDVDDFHWDHVDLFSFPPSES